MMMFAPADISEWDEGDVQQIGNVDR
jgi:hypothetical protein